jgi:hypothetical protein
MRRPALGDSAPDARYRFRRAEEFSTPVAPLHIACNACGRLEGTGPCWFAEDKVALTEVQT